MDHRHLDPRFTDSRQVFIIFAQAPTLAQPREGAFHNPTFRENGEGRRMAVADNLRGNAKEARTPMQQGRAIIASIKQHFLPAREQRNALEQVLGAIFVRPVGGMHQYPYQPALCIDHDIPFASFYFLAAVVATCAPFSVVLIDWLSTINTLGSASRPLSWRSFSRNASLIRSQVPSRRSLWKYVLTVDQFGKSCGIMRQEQPVRKMYRMPLMYSRCLTAGVRFWGSKTCNCSHCLSFKSVG